MLLRRAGGGRAADLPLHACRRGGDRGVASRARLPRVAAQSSVERRDRLHARLLGIVLLNAAAGRRRQGSASGALQKLPQGARERPDVTRLDHDPARPSASIHGISPTSSRPAPFRRPSPRATRGEAPPSATGGRRSRRGPGPRRRRRARARRGTRRSAIRAGVRAADRSNASGPSCAVAHDLGGTAARPRARSVRARRGDRRGPSVRRPFRRTRSRGEPLGPVRNLPRRRRSDRQRIEADAAGASASILDTTTKASTTRRALRRSHR